MALSYEEYDQSLGTINSNTPLAMRMMEHIPGITASVGFSSMRGSNTLIRGGFMDDTTRFAKSRSKFGIFKQGSLTPTKANASSFAFGSKRNIAGKDPFLKPSRLNNITARPRALGSMHSLSVFTAGSQGSGIYTFAQGHRLLNKLEQSGKLKMGGLRGALGVEAGTPLLGAGMFSAIAAGSKLDRMTRKGKLTGAALDKFGVNIQRLAAANNPVVTAGRLLATGSIGGASVPIRGAPLYDDAMRTLRAGGPGAKGVAGNLIASTIGGAGTQAFAGYFRGALGHMGRDGLAGASHQGARSALVDFKKALNQTDVLGKKVGIHTAKTIAQGSIVKQLGVSGIAKLGATKAGAKFLGARAAGFAIPGLQLVAAASLLYDLGKMGGELVKSGINLARDANRSLQGSINKPMFGMGYKDTELAATSRSRGVMAIQNSRLNARSALGSEASMMAAHFG